MITIIDLKELDELVAKELGYVKYSWKEECSSLTPNANWVYGGDYYAVDYTTWVPQKWYDKTEEDWELEGHINLEDYICNNEYSFTPKYSSSYAQMEEILNYFKNNSIRVDISSDKYLTKIDLIEENESGYYGANTYDYSVECGNKSNRSPYQPDSNINSLPLAMCLAFLKYKNIEVTLKLNE